MTTPLTPITNAKEIAKLRERLAILEFHISRLELHISMPLTAPSNPPAGDSTAAEPYWINLPVTYSDGSQ